MAVQVEGISGQVSAFMGSRCEEPTGQVVEPDAPFLSAASWIIAPPVVPVSAGAVVVPAPVHHLYTIPPSIPERGADRSQGSSTIKAIKLLGKRIWDGAKVGSKKSRYVGGFMLGAASFAWAPFLGMTWAPLIPRLVFSVIISSFTGLPFGGLALSTDSDNPSHNPVARNARKLFRYASYAVGFVPSVAVGATLGLAYGLTEMAVNGIKELVK